MSVQRTRPIDALQRIMTSFKHFEKKLDKLQDDLSVHGRTLSDLRAMVTNLSGGAIVSADLKSEDNRHVPKRSTAIQYEVKTYIEEPIKLKRKNAAQPVPPKLKTKGTIHSPPDLNENPVSSPFQVHVNKEVNSKTIKHNKRHRKADAQRKANLIRTQKVLEKKRSKLSKLPT